MGNFAARAAPTNENSASSISGKRKGFIHFADVAVLEVAIEVQFPAFALILYKVRSEKLYVLVICSSDDPLSKSVAICAF